MSAKIGKYDILEILGRGGMGVVYKAYDPILDREVALKTMTAEALKDPILRERFYREARAAGKLRHPNIVTIYELGEENNMPFIAMEYLHGHDLHHMIRMHEDVSLDRKIRIVTELCHGLAYAHKAGIVHRDIKPSNIRLTDDLQVKILDFGIARLITSQTMTTHGTVMGSIHYMSPEQIKAAHVDGKSDIFSVGIILYEILCYRKPFDAENTASILFKIVGEPPNKMDPPVDEQFPPLRRVLQKALDKDPARRYHSADEMADDLDDFLRSFEPMTRGGRPVPTQEYEVKVGKETKGAPPAPPQQTPTPYKSDPRAIDLMRTAKRLMVEGHAAQALTSVRQALEFDSENQEAKQLLQILEQDIQKSEVDDLLKQSHDYLREGRYDIAIMALEKILKLNPNHTKAKVLLEAVKGEMVSPHLDELLGKAKHAYSEKKFQVARKYAEEVLKVTPQNPEALELQMLLKERGSEQQFIELLDAGDRYYREKQYEIAEKALQKALKMFPNHPVAVKRMQDVKTAQTRVEIEHILNRGNKQLELGNYHEASESFQEILKLDSHNETAKMVIEHITGKLREEQVSELMNLGWRTLMMDRNYEEVVRIAEKILAMDPENTEAQSLITAARNELGQ
jgi:serine/threonine-protein kinase